MSLPSLVDDLALMREAARVGAAIAMTHFSSGVGVHWKGDRSPVSEADLAIDRELHDRLRAARPDYGWLSEERPDDGSRRTARRSFVLDPIDGTRAFIADRPDWCISLGLVEDGRPVAGLLVEPATENEYSACRGQGAYLNDKRLALPVAEPRAIPVYAGPRDAMAALSHHLEYTRHAYVPSLALRIAMVARGELDGTLVRKNSALWDIAAADLILEEAGGRLTGENRKPVAYGAPEVKLGAMVAAADPHFEPLLRVVEQGALV